VGLRAINNAVDVTNYVMCSPASPRMLSTLQS
jgi:phenylalanyl-tRNA synthetase beta subunit